MQIYQNLILNKIIQKTEVLMVQKSILLIIILYKLILKVIHLKMIQI